MTCVLEALILIVCLLFLEGLVSVDRARLENSPLLSKEVLLIGFPNWVYA